MNILFTINREYIEHMMDCICSIVRFPCSDGYDVYIMHSNLLTEDEQEISGNIGERARVRFICVDERIGIDFPKSKRYPVQIYYRIFASAILPDTLDRILYLDGDTLVINPLDTLYNMDFEGNYILACTHIRKVLNTFNRVRLGIKEEYPYINSGVMLMNLKALRENQNFGEVADFVEKHKNAMLLPDQDMLTALYGEKIGLLDTMIYNLSDRMLSIYNADITHEKRGLKWAREQAVVIHYCGRQKPWNDNYHGVLGEFYKEIRLLK